MADTDNIFILSLLEDRQNIIDSLIHETDLGCVLVGVNFLDLCLKLLLKEQFVNDKTLLDKIFENSTGNLGNYSSKIKLAKKLKIISPEQSSELGTIASIRNIFAHSYKMVTFSDEEITIKCAGLKLCDNSIPPYLRVVKLDSTEEEKHDISKRRFTYSVFDVMNSFFAKGILSKIIDDNPI